MNNSIQDLMSSTINNLKARVDVDAVVGDAVDCGNGTIVIPISTVNFGFGAGGTDFAPKSGSAVSEPMFGGGCGGGATVKPSGFLVVSNGNVRYLPVSNGATALDKVVDLMPDMIDKINRVFTQKKQNKNDSKVEIVD